MAGLETIPAIVREPADDETSSLELALIENLQRPISTRSRRRSPIAS